MLSFQQFLLLQQQFAPRANQLYHPHGKSVDAVFQQAIQGAGIGGDHMAFEGENGKTWDIRWVYAAPLNHK